MTTFTYEDIEQMMVLNDGRPMPHNRSLISTITDKAQESWKAIGKSLPTSLGPEFDIWEKHWLDTAHKWRDELQAEGLTETVNQLNKHIAFFENVINKH